MNQRIRVLALLLALVSGSAAASVVIPHTRVIYSGDAREQSLQFTNEDDSPSVMQVWIDSGDPNSTPEKADAPFVVTPPVFRIEPKAGQMVRVMFTGSALPQDRESVFYLNTLQIPSQRAEYADKNQMLILLRNRLKLFYRPTGIAGNAADAPGKLTFRVDAKRGAPQLAVSNPAGYYVTVLSGTVTCGATSATFKGDMLSPRGDATWPLSGGCANASQARSVSIEYVDDYGAIRKLERSLESGSQVR
ncbi:pilus assembly protein [Burkholderia sp. SRS-W-2-2016]|uniref:fimbrial biogenesis chaperone n=1 Tax=Burkholderia sp. SRS-W-2-2016 TaxID=1926878 RepID=UPI00094B633B|nr:molecular chaperone [Burkholderia sp. SRS-W-2-2016]OLL31340.1 pilus assembly protein [Burkholderia sp. SRS-W-2-2016]